MQLFAKVLIGLTLTAVVSCAAFGQDVYINTDNMSYSVQSQVDKSMWAWNLRLGTAAQNAGYTHAGCVDNAITYRRASLQEWTAAGGNEYSPGAFHAPCGNGGYNIIINHYFSNTSPQLIMHEMGHAMGAGHTSDTYAVMYESNITQAALSSHDISMALSGLNWSQYNTPDKCSVELLDNMDLYAPDISGKKAYLIYDGVVGGSHQWHKSYASTNSYTYGCTSSYIAGNGDLYLASVKSPSVSYSGITLTCLGNNIWRL